MGKTRSKPNQFLGAPPKINARQMEALTRIVREKNPLQLKFSYALWRLAMIRELIRQKGGAVVFFADESAVRSDYHARTTWSPTGKTTGGRGDRRAI